MIYSNVFKRICVIFLLVGLSSAMGASREGPWRVEITVSKQKFVECEPVAVTITHTNVSQSVKSLSPKKPSKISVSLNGGDPKQYYYFETLFEQVADIGVLPVKVQPQRSYAEEYWLLLGKTNLCNDWEFLFPKPGHYTVTFPGYNDEDIEFDVVRVSNTNDILAGQLFSVASAAVFLGEEQRKDKEKGVEDLQAICSKYASGKLAPYAALALARRLWRDEGKATFDLQKYYNYIDVIIEKHPAHYLSDKAYYMRAKGLNKEGKKDRVIDCLDALEKQHPKSKYVRIIEYEFGVKSKRVKEKKPQ